MLRAVDDTGEHDLPGVLKSVHVEGQVDGLLASMTITQRYRNVSGRTLEIVYTFPLADKAVLLDMTVTIGGERMRALVVDKATARERYEEAIDAEDSPILVEQTGSGLYTTNLGNIENGQEVLVELRYAQLLEFFGAWVDLRIPSVIAPRYGDPHRDGGLAAHESVDTDILAEYPLTLRMVLSGPAAQAEIYRSSHECAVNRLDDCTEITLRSEAMLDRDFALLLSGIPDSFAIAAPDGDKLVMLAAFRPEIQQVKEPMRLTILLDCSGSMAGYAMESAKSYLHGLLTLLDVDDIVSFTRFGDDIINDVNEAAGAGSVRNDIRRYIDNAQADMGGAKSGSVLVAALQECLIPDMERRRRVILLVTDGGKWNAREIIEAGMISGHRIFTVGVGPAPAEHLLQELAEGTGGICELLILRNSSLLATVEKMKSFPAYSVRVDWRANPIWEWQSHHYPYDGDMVYAFASFSEKPERPPVLHWTNAMWEESLAAERISLFDGDTLVRLAAAQRMAWASPEEKLELALKYQLVGEETALFLVRNREGVLSGELPFVHQVPQMMPAGHAGFGTMPTGRAEFRGLDGINMPEEQFDPTSFMNTIKIDFDFPSSSTEAKASNKKSVCDHTPIDLMLALAENVNQVSNPKQAVEKTLKLLRGSLLAEFLKTASVLHHIPVKQSHAIFLYWLAERMRNVYVLPPPAQEALRIIMKFMPREATAVVTNMLESYLPTISIRSWKN